MSKACILLVLITHVHNNARFKNRKVFIVIFESLTYSLVGGFNFENNTACTFIYLDDDLAANQITRYDNPEDHKANIYQYKTSNILSSCPISN